VSRDPRRDPDGAQTPTHTGSGRPGELSQRVGDARYEQLAQAADDKDTEGVGDTVKGWFRKAR
jgi:hypothetical protein